MKKKKKDQNRRRTFWASDVLWARITKAAGRDGGRTASCWLRSRAELALISEGVLS